LRGVAGAACSPRATSGSDEYSDQTGLEGPHTVILLDFLNRAWYFQNCTFEDTSMARTILQAIETAEGPERIYLYILTNRAVLFPVRPIPRGSAAADPPEEHWATQAKRMLDDAIARTYGLTPLDARVPANVAVSSYHAVRELGAAAAALPGPTSIVRVTYGFPMLMNIGAACQTITSEQHNAIMQRPVDRLQPGSESDRRRNAQVPHFNLDGRRNADSRSSRKSDVTYVFPFDRGEIASTQFSELNLKSADAALTNM
jgi:hypothetical protein